MRVSLCRAQGPAIFRDYTMRCVGFALEHKRILAQRVHGSLETSDLTYHCLKCKIILPYAESLPHAHALMTLWEIGETRGNQFGE